MQPYRRRAQYYETDQMAIVHHTNYIRWFEETRIEWMRQNGYGCRELEEQGLIIPVVDASAKYLRSVRFDDEVEIVATLTAFTGVRMAFDYTVRFVSDGTIAATGHTTHCFVDANQTPLSVKHRNPALYAALKALVNV
jgi:acyl-CoA thioester hydrolase